MEEYFKELERLYSVSQSYSDNSTRILRHFSKDDTVQHVTDVASKAKELALRYDGDVEKSMAAGILHDISVLIPNEERVAVAESRKMDLFSEEIAFPMIIHQKLSEEIARTIFGIEDDEINSAIGCHTTLKENPAKTDMIVFLADKISWDQEGDPPYLDTILRGLDASLEQGTFNFVSYLMENKDNLKVVHTWLVNAFDWFTEQGYSRS
jgi:predicted HD superfamily hydrolase involved in NAD metabolism